MSNKIDLNDEENLINNVSSYKPPSANLNFVSVPPSKKKLDLTKEQVLDITPNLVTELIKRRCKVAELTMDSAYVLFARGKSLQAKTFAYGAKNLEELNVAFNNMLNDISYLAEMTNSVIVVRKSFDVDFVTDVDDTMNGVACSDPFYQVSARVAFLPLVPQ